MTPFTMKYVRFLAGPSDAFPGGAEDWRPLLRIKLRSSDGKEVRLTAWIDSGCDICLFPLEIRAAARSGTFADDQVQHARFQLPSSDD